MVQNGRVYPDHACVHEFLDELFDFCNPYDVICTFSKAPDGTELGTPIGSCPPIGVIKVPLGGPKNT
mgnify:CR=1 FL=1